MRATEYKLMLARKRIATLERQCNSYGTKILSLTMSLRMARKKLASLPLSPEIQYAIAPLSRGRVDLLRERFCTRG